LPIRKVKGDVPGVCRLHGRAAWEQAGVAVVRLEVGRASGQVDEKARRDAYPQQPDRSQVQPHHVGQPLADRPRMTCPNRRYFSNGEGHTDPLVHARGGGIARCAGFTRRYGHRVGRYRVQSAVEKRVGGRGSESNLYKRVAILSTPLLRRASCGLRSKKSSIAAR
jgi:hypothetical protein